VQVYDESTMRRAIARIRLNWSRELAFSSRQINYLNAAIPQGRGIYAVYAKDHLFPYDSPDWPTQRWSSCVYLGSGWIGQRLCRHLARRENDVLSGYIDNFRLACRYAFVTDSDEDWPKVAEASLLRLFVDQYDNLPPANRRRESIYDFGLHVLHVDESENFRFIARGW
jgi:hypothetical protein